MRMRVHELDGGGQLRPTLKDLANEGFRIPRSVYARVLDRFAMGHVDRAEWGLWAQVLSEDTRVAVTRASLVLESASEQSDRRANSF